MLCSHAFRYCSTDHQEMLHSRSQGSRKGEKILKLETIEYLYFTLLLIDGVWIAPFDCSNRDYIKEHRYVAQMLYNVLLSTNSYYRSEIDNTSQFIIT